MASKYLQKFPVPDNFYEILHDFSREVIRDQPEDIIEYGSLYFDALEQVHPFILSQLLFVFPIGQTLYLWRQIQHQTCWSESTQRIQPRKYIFKEVLLKICFFSRPEKIRKPNKPRRFQTIHHRFAKEKTRNWNRGQNPATRSTSSEWGCGCLQNASWTKTPKSPRSD